MSGVIDCAVLLHAARENWLDAWLSSSMGVHAKLRLHAYELVPGHDGLPNIAALRQAGLALRRYDVAILPVSYTNLSWVRTALANLDRQHGLSVPLMALVEALRAPAIQDLFDLGVTDFLRRDDSLDDLRVRLMQMTSTRGVTGHRLSTEAGGNDTHGYVDTDSPLALPPVMLQELFHDSNETFRIAKTRVVANFERDYVARALSRHAGNISMAARAAQKHRRAFWALMRKHRIDAAQYRRPGCYPENTRAATI